MKLDSHNKGSLLAELRAAGAEIKADGREIKCPFHDDQHASGGIYQADDGVWRFKCHAGSCGFCGDVFDVLSAAENKPLTEVLKENKLSPAIPKGRQDAKNIGESSTGSAPKVYETLEAIQAVVPGNVEAVYRYTDPATQAVDLAVIRYRKEDGRKAFWQVSPLDGGWVTKRPKGLLPLYNRTAVAGSNVVICSEGEKTVHALRTCGFVGTTSPMGAGKASYADWTPLAGKMVILWPDNDEAGIKHMKEVAEIVGHLSPRPRLFWVDPASLNLPEKGDVVEFIDGKDQRSASEAIVAVCDAAMPMGAAGELFELIEDTISGKRASVPWPWGLTSTFSRALLPGTITLFCGAPGASKSFAILQALQYWTKDGIRAVAFELEEDRAYHLNRFFAQECERSEVLDDGWVKSHPDEVRRLMHEHSNALDSMGATIYAAPKEQVDYPKLVKWTEDRAKEGNRIIVIDPVTAVSPTQNVWVADSEFIFQVKTIAREYACSIVLVTHPRKGRGLSCGMDDLAGGAAFQRFAQTVMWLESYRPAKTFILKGPCGSFESECNRTLHLFKTRNGSGTGLSIAMKWDDQSLTLAEQGLIVKEIKQKKHEV